MRTRAPASARSAITASRPATPPPTISTSSGLPRSGRFIPATYARCVGAASGASPVRVRSCHGLRSGRTSLGRQAVLGEDLQDTKGDLMKSLMKRQKPLIETSGLGLGVVVWVVLRMTDDGDDE